MMYVRIQDVRLQSTLPTDHRDSYLSLSATASPGHFLEYLQTGQNTFIAYRVPLNRLKHFHFLQSTFKQAKTLSFPTQYLQTGQNIFIPYRVPSNRLKHFHFLQSTFRQAKTLSFPTDYFQTGQNTFIPYRLLSNRSKHFRFLQSTIKQAKTLPWQILIHPT